MLPSLWHVENKYVTDFFVKPHTHTHKEREKGREGGGKDEGLGRGGGKRGTHGLGSGRLAPSSDCGFLALRQPQMSVGAAISRTGSSSRQLAKMDQT